VGSKKLRWRGDPNRGPGRGARRRPAGKADRIEGVVRWTEHEASLIHVEVEDTDGVRDPLEGEIVALDLSRARVRVEVADRDGDGRIDAHDIVLGDRVEADVADVAAIDPGEPVRSVSRVRVFRP
jgi:hypothetical protein